MAVRRRLKQRHATATCEGIRISVPISGLVPVVHQVRVPIGVPISSDIQVWFFTIFGCSTHALMNQFWLLHACSQSIKYANWYYHACSELQKRIDLEYYKKWVLRAILHCIKRPVLVFKSILGEAFTGGRDHAPTSQNLSLGAYVQYWLFRAYFDPPSMHHEN